MDRSEIILGIEGHAYMQAEIGALILEHGNCLSETEFDREFGKWDRPFVPAGVRGDSFILAGMFNGSPQQSYLHLAQLMIRAGLITAESRDGLVYYSIPE